MQHAHEDDDGSPGASVLHELARYGGPGTGVDHDRVDPSPEGCLHLGVDAVHDREEFLIRTRDRDQEPDLLRDGLAAGPALELPDQPIQAISVDAPSGVAVRDPAVWAVRAEQWEQVVDKVVAAGLGRRPSDGDGEGGCGAEAEEPRNPLAVQDGTCRVLARG